MRFSALVALSGLVLLASTSAASADEELPGPVKSPRSAVCSRPSTSNTRLCCGTRATWNQPPARTPRTALQCPNTICDVGLWSGSKPKSRGAVIQKAKSGQGAQVGVETWAPNEGSPNVEDWIKEGYEKTTSEFPKTRFALVYKIP